MYDLWWNPAVEDQAIDRAHRIGQDSQVDVYRLVSRGTYEERINQMLDTKRHLSSECLADQGIAITEMSDAELNQLFTWT